MSIEESPEEKDEKATVLSHIANAEFPSIHLAPWMSKLNERQVAALAALKNIADVGRELGRREWLDDHPDEHIPDSMESKHPDNEDGDEEDRPEFELDRVRGGADMFGWCAENYAQHIHDMAVSIDGLGRRQGIGYGSALKSGHAIEPKKRSFLDKITGRNKDNQQPSGGA